MEVRQVISPQEGKVTPARDHPGPRPCASPKETSPEGRPPVPQRVDPILRAPDVHEMARHIAEVLNEAMRSLKFSLSFEPAGDGESITIRVVDGDGRLIRTIPLSEFLSLARRLTDGTWNSGFLADKVIR